MLDVVEMRGFHDGVHAAQRQRDEGAWDAFAGVEDLVGIGAGEAAAGFVLDGSPGFFSDFDEAVDHVRVVRAGGQAGLPEKPPLGVRARVRVEAGELDGRDPAQVPVPGLAPAAKQGGVYVARALRARIRGRRWPAPFVYRHLGSLATIGRKAAVAAPPVE